MKILKIVFPVLTLACVASVAQAGADQTLSASNESGAAGSSVTATISLDNDTGDIQGWSWGLEHDPSVADIQGGDVVDGSATATVGSGGAAPAFNQINVLGTGWTVGVVIDFLGCCTLAPGSGYEMNLATYSLVGGAGDSTDLCFVDTLGSPPVATVMVIGGASVPPSTNCGSLEILEALPGFEYSIADQSLEFPFGDPNGSFTANAAIQDTEDPTDDTQGFSMGVAHDDSILTVTSVSAINELAGLNGDTGPSFFGENILADGWTVGVVYNFLGGVFLQFPGATEIVAADYDYAGVGDGQCATLAWSNELGSPPVANVVVVGGQSLDVTFDDGEICFTEGPEEMSVNFIRGDANNDSIVNIADCVFVIGTLFYGYTADCVVAGDANFDGMVDLSDATYIIAYRFQDGPEPPAPFPACGESLDAGDNALGCESGACAP